MDDTSNFTRLETAPSVLMRIAASEPMFTFGVYCEMLASMLPAYPPSPSRKQTTRGIGVAVGVGVIVGVDVGVGGVPVAVLVDVAVGVAVGSVRRLRITKWMISSTPSPLELMRKSLPPDCSPEKCASPILKVRFFQVLVFPFVIVPALLVAPSGESYSSVQVSVPRSK